MLVQIETTKDAFRLYCLVMLVDKLLFSVTVGQPDQHLCVPHGPGPHPSPQISRLRQWSVTQLILRFCVHKAK